MSAGAEPDEGRVCRIPNWAKKLFVLWERRLWCVRTDKKWGTDGKGKRKNCREAVRIGKNTERGKNAVFMLDTLQRPT